MQRAERAHHERDALRDAERAGRLAGDELHGEGGREDANQHPHIKGSGRKQEPSHPALLRNLK